MVQRGQLWSIAGHAFLAEQLDSQKSGPALGRQHPRTHLPRRIVPHVLPVPALEIGDPVPFLVGMKPDDFPGDGLVHQFTNAPIRQLTK